MKTFKSYVCMRLANYYADALDPHGADTVTDAPRPGPPKQILYTTPAGEAICGSVKFSSPQSIGDGNHQGATARIIQTLTQINDTAFENARPRIRAEAFRVAELFLPPRSVNDPAPTVVNIEQIAEDFQRDVEARLRAADVSQTAMQDITNAIKNGAETQGWSSAGAWFLAITRAQGAILTSGMALPEATGPNLEVLEQRQTMSGAAAITDDSSPGSPSAPAPAPEPLPSMRLPQTMPGAWFIFLCNSMPPTMPNMKTLAKPSRGLRTTEASGSSTRS